MNFFIKQIAALPAKERNELFQEAGLKKGLAPFHIEKDYWVCWVLSVFFDSLETSSLLTFRGGTSLSKAWGLIERFSEDIDLAISREWLPTCSKSRTEWSGR